MFYLFINNRVDGRICAGCYQFWVGEEIQKNQIQSIKLQYISYFGSHQMCDGEIFSQSILLWIRNMYVEYICVAQN